MSYITILGRKEDYFLDLAAEEEWPKEKLREKVTGIRTRRAEIERTLSQTSTQLDHGRDVFYAAVDLLERPQDAYSLGNETVRAILNRAFFTKLYVDGGKVIDHDTEEPFTALLEVYRVDRRIRAGLPADGTAVANLARKCRRPAPSDFCGSDGAGLLWWS